MEYKKVFVEYFIIALSWLLTYFSPVFHVVFAIGFLVICDFITGLIKAKKAGGWCEIKSKKMRWTIGKFMVYGIAILASNVVEKTFMPEVAAVKIISGLIALSELKSIDENIKEITGVSLFGKLLEILNLKSK